jgi:FMN-dependent NADH-azoreductase
MKKGIKTNPKSQIRTLFKELIKRYKSNNYKEEIVQVKSNVNKIPTFQLRFVKQGEDCKYYRILLNDVRMN